MTDKSFEITVLDCLRGLEQALQLGWYSFKDFELQAYERGYKLSEGDMNWIIPGKIMAFSSPVSPHLGFKHEGLRPQRVLETFIKLAGKDGI